MIDSFFNNFRRLLLISFSLIALSVSMLINLQPVSAAFDPLGKPCEDVTSSSVCEDSANPGDPLNGNDGIFSNAVDILSFLAGVIAVVVIVVAGITMITSQGDAGKVKSSRDAIIYAAVGIAVIVLARTIVIFVFNRV